MRLLLIEDEFGLGDALTAYLNMTGRAVQWVRSFAEGEAASRNSAHDLLIVDLRLPDGNGLDLITKLRKSGDIRPLIVISAQDQIRDRIAGLNAGADDYVTKPFNLHELDARIEALKRRSFGRPGPVVSAGDVRIDVVQGRVWVRDNEVRLSHAEWKVLAKLCSPAGRSFQKVELQRALSQGRSAEISGNAVEVYVNRLRGKLGLNIITSKRGVGYRIAT